ncbi:uncharacterized protein LOC121395346 isoform X2 [Xenopus laevis]|uniref:Uncharacterized protein LOC121395346 isoform X2 n=1 Tax=Xenopus laevis TaxID=8355 RepID=A0A8J1L4X9_XENLA|nr:uncharacterized protein LOC121395346 isoform X2 [Xenopus laevis]
MADQAHEQASETANTQAFCMHDIEFLNDTRGNKADLLFTAGATNFYNSESKSMSAIFYQLEKLMLAEQRTWWDYTTMERMRPPQLPRPAMKKKNYTFKKKKSGSRNTYSDTGSSRVSFSDTAYTSDEDAEYPMRDESRVFLNAKRKRFLDSGDPGLGMGDRGDQR